MKFQLLNAALMREAIEKSTNPPLPWILRRPKNRLFEGASHAVQTADVCPRLATRIPGPGSVLVLHFGVPQRERTVRREERFEAVGIAQDAV